MKQKQLSLTQRYAIESGLTLMTGIQALVRLPLDQMRADRAKSLNTGAFISGYRGSPLGGYDLELHRNKNLLEQYNVRFQPGINEELGATAVWGSQQVNLFEGATVDGVCGIWYGKSPGVDRSTDVFRHGNAAGSSEKGGVLVVVGDDHGCKSSSYPGQSEFAFVDVQIPVLNPADVQEVLDYGRYGIELSRYSGCWVAMITLSENMDSAAVVNVDEHRLRISHPANHQLPSGGVNIRLNDSPLAQEERLWRYKRPAALAFCRENKLNKIVIDNPEAILGIVTAGKAHLDMMQALDDLGIDIAKAKRLGIRLYKVGMTYPLDIEGIKSFARGLDYLFVVEEKRSLMEVQLKEELYNVEIYDPHFPKIIGKLDSHDNPLMPAYGELSPKIIAKVLVQALPNGYRDESIEKRLCVLESNEKLGDDMTLAADRTPFFCSGCPHNTSTKVPDGSRALAGIGCHYLVQNMDRNTQTFTQMGGEGVSWIGQSHFTETEHVFVNLGDGTYFHSGVLAIRAAVAAKVNITYKILFNDAVAMTGGQPHDGALRPDLIVNQVLAEGVTRVALVMDDINKYHGVLAFPREVEIYHRDDLDDVQREFRKEKGVTCIVYDQMCATELRRKRKRHLLPPVAEKVVINAEVCEGCGDCSEQSNCIAVEPLETPLGVKRQINQTSCNQDFSCVKGFCPSFVTVIGKPKRGADDANSVNGIVQLKKPKLDHMKIIALGESLPKLANASLESPWNILVAGIGGTGVVTVSALLLTAAFLEGKIGTTLDQTGLAQKGGAVYSHIRLAYKKEDLHTVRIPEASASVLVACDIVAAVHEPFCLSKLDRETTQAVVNTHLVPTSHFVLGEVPVLDSSDYQRRVERRVNATSFVNAHKIVEALFGTTTSLNIFMLGVAYQQGGIPLDVSSLYQAIELNGVAVDENKAAFNAGRLAVGDASALEEVSSGVIAERHLSKDNKDLGDSSDIDELINDRYTRLSDYQNRRYADQYLSLVQRVKIAENATLSGSSKLVRAVAINAYQLMAYKDEYEVARLYTNGKFMQKLKETFEGNVKLQFHLAPPIFSRPNHAGVTKKMLFGGWVYPLFNILAQFKFLRGTVFDVFGYNVERKTERASIKKYLATVDVLLKDLRSDNIALASKIAALPADIRGYGHIKMRNFDRVKPRWDAMLDHYSKGHTSYHTIDDGAENAAREVVQIIRFPNGNLPG